MKRIIIVLILILFGCNAPVYAGYEYHIEGSEVFNTTADSIISGKLGINAGELLNRICNMLFAELAESRGMLVSVIVIAVISGTLSVMRSSFGENGAGEAAFFACYTLMTAAAMKMFTLALSYGREVVGTLSDFTTKFFPILSVMLVSSGNAASASAFYPVLSCSVYVLSQLINKCIIPMSAVSALLAVINNLSGRVQISNFTSLLRSVSGWLMTGAFTLFTGINALYGFSTPAMDELSLRTVKFAVGSVVPVVGSFVAESVEAVLAGARLAKNAVGTAGIAAMLAASALPVMKLGTMLIMLRLSAAAVEPICDKRFSELLSDIAGAVTMLLAMVIACIMLFSVSVGIIMSATSA